MESNSRKNWVDYAKLIAIVGVIIDHTNGFLYTDQKIAYASYFSVSLFIIMMGITSYWSYSAYKGNVIDKLKRNVTKIFIPYVASVFIYTLFRANFDFLEFVRHIVYFDNTFGSYYVLLYMQLAIIAPLLFYCLSYSKTIKIGFILDCFLGTILLAIGNWASMNTNILEIYGGGGKLFGGTYLFVLWIGMMFGKYVSCIAGKWYFHAMALILSIIALIYWIKNVVWKELYIDIYFPVKGIINPPGFSIIVYAFLITVFLFSLDKTIWSCKETIIHKIYNGISLIGQHTLYIFLYHMLVGYTIIPIVIEKISLTDISDTNRFFIYLVTMLLLPLLVEYLLKQVNCVIKKAYNEH